jgi:hypothetical protein
MLGSSADCALSMALSAVPGKLEASEMQGASAPAASNRANRLTVLLPENVISSCPPLKCSAIEVCVIGAGKTRIQWVPQGASPYCRFGLVSGADAQYCELGDDGAAYSRYSLRAFSRSTILASSRARSRVISPSLIMALSAWASASRALCAAIQPDSSHPISSE